MISRAFVLITFAGCYLPPEPEPTPGDAAVDDAGIDAGTVAAFETLSGEPQGIYPQGMRPEIAGCTGPDVAPWNDAGCCAGLVFDTVCRPSCFYLWATTHFPDGGYDCPDGGQ